MHLKSNLLQGKTRVTSCKSACIIEISRSQLTTQWREKTRTRTNNVSVGQLDGTDRSCARASIRLLELGETFAIKSLVISKRTFWTRVFNFYRYFYDTCSKMNTTVLVCNRVFVIFMMTSKSLIKKLLGLQLFSYVNGFNKNFLLVKAL